MDSTSILLSASDEITTTEMSSEEFDYSATEAYCISTIDQA